MTTFAALKGNLTAIPANAMGICYHCIDDTMSGTSTKSELSNESDESYLLYTVDNEPIASHQMPLNHLGVRKTQRTQASSLPRQQAEPS
jgi:hypothetical protein